MAGKGSAPGERRGGRQKGTPNKKTKELRDLLERHGMTDETHPAVQMFKVYTGEITMPVVVTRRTEDGVENEIEEVPLEPSLRVKCMSEVLQYLEPKRKAIEVEGDPDTLPGVYLVREPPTESA